MHWFGALMIFLAGVCAGAYAMSIVAEQWTVEALRQLDEDRKDSD